MTLLPPLAPLLLPIVLLRIALVSPTVPPPRRLAIALATAPVAVAPVARARPPRRPIAPVIATPVIVAPLVVAPIVISAWWGRRRVARSYGWSRMLRDRHAQLAPINLLAITALDSRLCFLFGGEADEAEAAALAGVVVLWKVAVLDLAKLTEHGMQITRGDRERKVVHLERDEAADFWRAPRHFVLQRGKG